MSGWYNNHSLLIDLRTKFPDLTGRVAERRLVEADITTNKNMVPLIAVAHSKHRVYVLELHSHYKRIERGPMGEIVEMIDSFS